MKRSPRLARTFKYRAFGAAATRPCYWCERPLKWTEATVDHIVALGLGGQDVPDNLVLACWPCNQIRAKLETLLAIERRRDLVALAVHDLRGNPRAKAIKALRHYDEYLRRNRHLLPAAIEQHRQCEQIRGHNIHAPSQP